jgi:hypothetical protein
MIMEIIALMRPRKSALDANSPLSPHDRIDARGDDSSFMFVPEDFFMKALSIEQKRAERSERRFVLMLIDTRKALQAEGGDIILEGIAKALSVSTRETDLHGWYNNGSVVGVICTEIGTGDMPSILSALHSKVDAAFQSRLEPEQVSSIDISFQVFPQVRELNNDVSSAENSRYPDMLPVGPSNLSDFANAQMAS